MEKLSSILPNNSRVKSVDLSQAHPVRPGTPAMGRPVGTTASIRDRVSISSASAAAANRLEIPQEVGDLLTYKNPQELKKAKVVASISQNFFNTRLDPRPSPLQQGDLSQPTVKDFTGPETIINPAATTTTRAKSEIFTEPEEFSSPEEATTEGHQALSETQLQSVLDEVSDPARNAQKLA